MAEQAGSAFKNAAPYLSLEAPHPVLDAAGFPKDTAMNQPPGQQVAFAHFYPNGLPVTYNLIHGVDSGGVAHQYVENHLPVRFYTHPPPGVAAKFSTLHGQLPFRFNGELLPERRVHLWNKDEIQSVCNSLRHLHWTDMKKMRRPARWDDLWEYYDAYDLYNYGALNLWNVMNTLYDENVLIGSGFNSDQILEVGHFSDQWIKKPENQERLKEWHGGQGSVLSLMAPEDWKEISNLEDTEISLLKSALLYRRRMLLAIDQQHYQKPPAVDLLTACRLGNLVNWLADSEILGQTGLPSPPPSEPHYSSSPGLNAAAPWFVYQGHHYFHPGPQYGGQFGGQPYASVQSGPSNAVEVLQKSADAATMKRGGFTTESGVVIAMGSSKTPPGWEKMTSGSFGPKTAAVPESQPEEPESTTAVAAEAPSIEPQTSFGSDTVSTAKTPRASASSPNLRELGQFTDQNADKRIPSAASEQPTSSKGELDGIFDKSDRASGGRAEDAMQGHQGSQEAAEAVEAAEAKEPSNEGPAASGAGERPAEPVKTPTETAAAEARHAPMPPHHIPRLVVQAEGGPSQAHAQAVQSSLSYVVSSPPRNDQDQAQAPDFGPARQAHGSAPELPPRPPFAGTPQRNYTAPSGHRGGRFASGAGGKWPAAEASRAEAASAAPPMTPPAGGGTWQAGRNGRGRGRGGLHGHRNETTYPGHHGDPCGSGPLPENRQRHGGVRDGNNNSNNECRNLHSMGIFAYRPCTCPNCRERNRSVWVVAHEPPDSPVEDVRTRIRYGLQGRFGEVEDVIPRTCRDGTAFIVRFRNEASVADALSFPGGLMPEKQISVAIHAVHRSKWVNSTWRSRPTGRDAPPHSRMATGYPSVPAAGSSQAPNRYETPAAPWPAPYPDPSFPPPVYRPFPAGAPVPPADFAGWGPPMTSLVDTAASHHHGYGPAEDGHRQTSTGSGNGPGDVVAPSQDGWDSSGAQSKPPSEDEAFEETAKDQPSTPDSASKARVTLPADVPPHLVKAFGMDRPAEKVEAAEAKRSGRARAPASTVDELGSPTPAPKQLKKL
ncbi:hypothetical protein CDD83_1895 [Cordyceps sp. RAO-2017]|nr:hypothetical protein CDD83_1895 [Cordyceps sp. RAO-2017]